MLEVINQEFDVVIGDKTFVCKTLSLSSLLKLSRKLKERDALKKAELIAQTLPKEQRGKFMLDVWNEMGKPESNEEETAFADALFTTVHGITEIIKYAITKFNDIKESELDDLLDANFTSDYFNYLSKLAYKIIGFEAQEDSAEETEEDTKKKSDDTMTK